MLRRNFQNQNEGPAWLWHTYDNIYNLQRSKLYHMNIIIRLKFTPLKEMPLVDVKYTTQWIDLPALETILETLQK